MHSGAFEEDQYDFLISIINKTKSELTSLYSDIPCDDDFGDFNDDYDEFDRTQHIFNFVDVPSFVLIFSGSLIEPLYFVKVTEKGAATENHSDPYGYFLFAGEKILKWFFYLKLARSRNASKKKYQILPTEIVFFPDEVFDTYQGRSYK